MASTSWVFSFRAITVGSLRTIPRPFVYTSVLAVPRSMARSLARAGPRPLVPRRRSGSGGGPAALGRRRAGATGGALVGSQCPQLAVERLDPGFDRRGLAVAHDDDQGDDHAHHQGRDQVEQVLHQVVVAFEPSSSTSVTSWAQVPQSTPPSHVSRFQIGTVALRVSIPKRAASNASPRWGALATTITELSASSSAPTRCRSTKRPVSGQRRR